MKTYFFIRSAICMKESVMFRRFIIAIATVAALGISFGATDAPARGGHGGGGHGGGHGGGFHGGGFHGGGYRGGGWRGGGGWGVGAGLLGGAIIGGMLASPYYYGYGPYYYGGGPYYGGCYRTIRVATPYGPRWRRVWVCQ